MSRGDKRRFRGKASRPLPSHVKSGPDPALYFVRKISGRPCVPGKLLEEPDTRGRLRRTVSTAAPRIRQVLLHLCPVSSKLSGHDVLAPETPRTSLRSDNYGTRKSQTAFRYLPEPPLLFGWGCTPLGACWEDEPERPSEWRRFGLTPGRDVCTITTELDSRL